MPIYKTNDRLGGYGFFVKLQMHDCCIFPQFSVANMSQVLTVFTRNFLHTIGVSAMLQAVSSLSGTLLT